MSMLPIFRATLDNSLSAKECDDVVKQIKKIKGVLSAAFNEESNQKQILVTYCPPRHGNHVSVADKVRRIRGIKDIKTVF